MASRTSCSSSTTKIRHIWRKYSLFEEGKSTGILSVVREGISIRRREGERLGVGHELKAALAQDRLGGGEGVDERIGNAAIQCLAQAGGDDLGEEAALPEAFAGRSAIETHELALPVEVGSATRGRLAIYVGGIDTQ